MLSCKLNKVCVSVFEKLSKLFSEACGKIVEDDVVTGTRNTSTIAQLCSTVSCYMLLRECPSALGQQSSPKY